MSDFAPEGYAPFPSLYADYQQMGELASWDDDVLKTRLDEYAEFVKGDLMPRARETSELIIGHLVFELMWREQDRENG